MAPIQLEVVPQDPEQADGEVLEEEEEAELDENYDPTDFLHNLGGPEAAAGGHAEAAAAPEAQDLQPQVIESAEGMEVVADNIQVGRDSGFVKKVFGQGHGLGHILGCGLVAWAH